MPSSWRGNSTIPPPHGRPVRPSASSAASSCRCRTSIWRLPSWKRAVQDLGLRVANVPAEVRGTYLGDAQFRPFWEAAQDLGGGLFMHPDGAKDPWFFQWGMWNSLGQSLEEAKFMASVIYEGILEAYPRLKLVLAHGGGYFPHNMGRLDRNVKNAPHSMKNITRKPSEYLKNVYYDTLSIRPNRLLSALIKIVGPDRLLLGSDWPIGEADPVGFVNRCPDIDDAEKCLLLMLWTAPPPARECHRCGCC